MEMVKGSKITSENRRPTAAIGRRGWKTTFVEKLLGTLVNETKSMHRETIHQAYKYTCKVSDSEPESFAETTTYSDELGKSEC
ncbi:hypothetical protein LINPERHAP1_LOCUS22232 [Linum perenne]